MENRSTNYVPRKKIFFQKTKSGLKSFYPILENSLGSENVFQTRTGAWSKQGKRSQE